MRRNRGAGRGYAPRNKHRFSESTLSQSVGAQSTCSTVNVDAKEAVNDGCNDALENPKFKAACEKIKESISKYVGDGTAFESSSSEEELDESEIIQKTFGQYSGGEASVLSNTQELLQDLMTSGAAVCLICIQSMKRNDHVWSCENCYCMLHVSCIQKWAKDSMFHLSEIAQETNKREDIKWCCPKCRHDYEPKDVPSRYFCFCGKTENPVYDPWIVPHSCGKICGKKLKPLCGHQCVLLCHPGPCPPCPKTVQTSCYCKRSRPIVKRCSNKEWSCVNPCEKILSCKQHYCTEPCHGGNCSPCKLQSEQSCACGSAKQFRPCDNPLWNCNKVCGKPLDCNNHLCMIVCHSGECGTCPKAGPRLCPCKKKVMQLPCTEEVLPCGDTCSKPLECGLHFCNQRCHFGDCDACLQMRVMRCRCGQKEKSVPCCREFICDIKCKRKRDCGKHNCNRKCCIEDCPPCEAPCGRTLSCGTHKCQSRCHAGPCFPCNETVEVKCFCGNTKISVPCGRKKTAHPPRCRLDCNLPPICHHTERQQHRCHFGNCPPCRKLCDKIHPCGHSCPIKCHSAVLTKVELKKKKDGPWDLVNSYKMELLEHPCPPCIVPVSVTCIGDHVVHDFPCHESRAWACDAICGRKLDCSNHVCNFQCHNVGNAPDSIKQGDKCEPCERLCEKGRPKECTHSCHRVCHPGDCQPCKESIKMRCFCQVNQLYIVCTEWTSASESKRDELQSCKNTCPKQLSCGHRCPKTCHNGPCPDRSVCKKKITIRCQCKRLKKEFYCVNLKENENVLACDKECLESRKQKQAQEEAQKELERREKEKEQEQELEKFRRKMEGKKRKAKKPKEIIQEHSWARRHYLIISSSVIAIIALCTAYYILYL